MIASESTDADATFAVRFRGGRAAARQHERGGDAARRDGRETSRAAAGNELGGSCVITP